MDQDARGLGITLALVSAVGFALSNSIVGLAYQGGTNPMTVSATRFILPLIVLVVILKARSIPLFLPRRVGIAAFILGIVTAGYTLALLSALDKLPVGIAILVFYIFPLVTSFEAAALRLAPLRTTTVIGAVVAFGGLALALGVKIDEYEVTGIVLAAAAGVGLGTVSAVSGRVIATSHPMQATLYMSAGALISFVVIVLIVGGFKLPETGVGWTGFWLTHLFYAAAMIMFFTAIGAIGAPLTTILSNIEPLVAISAGFILLDQSLSPLQLLGAAIVVLALFIAARK